jgi:3-oxoacyl-[acyl-carrier protein] reductase
MKLEGKIALVTGAAAGFGAGIARRFAAEGARVVCADIDGAAAKTMAGSLPSHGGASLSVQCDVSDGASVGAMIAEATRALGGFDILVNNAGMTQKPSRIARIAEADLDRLLAVNIKSLYHMAVHALPVLRQRGGGVVINIASVAGMRPRPGMTWYNASKAAMIAITESMAAELAPDRIRVNAIAPSVGQTQMFTEMYGADSAAAAERLIAMTPLGRLCAPDDVAGAALYLASDDAAFVTGVILPVDGGRLVA